MPSSWGIFSSKDLSSFSEKPLLFLCYLFIVFEQKTNDCLLMFPVAGATFTPKKGSPVQTPKCCSAAHSLELAEDL